MSKKMKWLTGAGVLLGLMVVVLGSVYAIVTRQVHGLHFDSDGVNIHYTDEGSGEAVILVHGYTANADLNWRLPGLHKKLAQDFRVITMDVRGHGRSDKPHEAPQYGIEMVHDVQRLMDHLKLDKAHLVGYSMGGFIVLKFMAMYPERLISAMPCGAAWMPPGDPLEALAVTIHDGLMGANVSVFAPLQRAVLGLVMDLTALGALAQSFKELAVPASDLAKVTIPVMAVKGGKEEVVLGGGDLRSALPQYEETIIPGGRHNSVIFYTGFHDAIVGFLNKHRLSPRE